MPAEGLARDRNAGDGSTRGHSGQFCLAFGSATRRDPLTQALAAEGAPHGPRVVCLYPGAMATHWGAWNPAARDNPRPAAAPQDALPPGDVADYIAWLVCAAAHLIVTEAIIAPIRERGWP